MGSKTCSNPFWTREKDKVFENALAIYSDDSNLWEKIAATVPGRTLEEIKIHYEILVADVNAIELGLVPLPRYADSFKKSKKLLGHAAVDRKGKKSEKAHSESSCRGISLRSNRYRKRAQPWSEEEHGLFLHGLGKYGRGDWRSISRLCVRSRTPTQVASHAQKYFKRMAIVDKRTRSSIHDMTILDNGKILSQQVPATQLVSGASSSSLMDTGLYPSVTGVGGGYLHGSLIDSQCSLFSHMSSTEDASAGIDLLEYLLDSLVDTPTPQGPSSQQISGSTSASLCTPLNASQHIPTHKEVIIEDMITPVDLEIFNSLFIFQHDMCNSGGPIIGDVIGTSEQPHMLNFEELSFPVHPDFGVHAPPTASQPPLEPLPPDVGIEMFPWSSRFDMDSPNFAAFFL